MKKTTNIKASSKVNNKNIKTKNSKNSNNKKVVKKKNVENKVNVLKNKTFKFGENKRNIYLSIFVIFMLAVLLIVSSYAWFSTALNVKINTFNMVVMRNSGLTISHNAITYSSYIDISRELLYDDLGDTYPNYKTMWNSNGLIPVSTNGNKNPNSHFFDVYTTSGVFYPNLRDNTTGTVTTALYDQSRPKKYAQFLAFDIFLKNDSGSPISDNLYFDSGTGVFLTEEVAENITEEMTGLVNSMRIGIVKVGSLPIDATPTEVQNITCNND